MHEFLSWVESTEFSTWIRESGSLWSYPIVLTMHTIGLGILVGFNWAVDLRLLGFSPKVQASSMARFFPLMWLGFWINFFSGIVLLIADATTKGESWVFWLKMFLVICGMIILRRIQVKVFTNPDIDKGIPDYGRHLAALSLACWAGAIFIGRMTAYWGPQVGLVGPQVK
jgi:hypothetical protein